MVTASTGAVTGCNGGKVEGEIQSRSDCKGKIKRALLITLTRNRFLTAQKCAQMLAGQRDYNRERDCFASTVIVGLIPGLNVGRLPPLKIKALALAKHLAIVV
ncbi:hypothetical protein KTAU_11300 [Thermogemmatispora aurantia]|uniref:Uncharacterized protein n=1 Tax=Thermogemmatispora aurantia TaxID=2045279 RepID=A0A5J4K4Q9_9CHLR|nr:hypothetical protein KTAU_11300 [Thermogemmatispora aurantia]